LRTSGFDPLDILLCFASYVYAPLVTRGVANEVARVAKATPNSL